MRNKVEIKTEKLPYEMRISFGPQVFVFSFDYNSIEDCYVAHLYKDGALVCGGERLVYGRSLFADCYEVERYPALRLVPYDESGAVDVVTKATMGSLVLLTVDDGEGPDGE